jgi:hypothetical protein
MTSAQVVASLLQGLAKGGGYEVTKLMDSIGYRFTRGERYFTMEVGELNLMDDAHMAGKMAVRMFNHLSHRLRALEARDESPRRRLHRYMVRRIRGAA